MLSGMNTSRPWGDWMVEMDEDRSHRILRMTDAEWKEFARKTIAGNRGRGDLRPVLNWLDTMEEKRAEFKSRVVTLAPVRNPDPTFRAWRDMILEPAKYGSEDWTLWLQWNEELLAGPGRWRVSAFWAEIDAKEEARLREECAIRIQAAWRGHAVRDSTPGLNCQGCLARVISPKHFNGMHLCRGCCDDVDAYTFVAKFETPVVPRAHLPPVPRAEPDEHDLVPCDGCGRVVCAHGDYGEYRPGWWCSRRCAYD